MIRKIFAISLIVATLLPCKALAQSVSQREAELERELAKTKAELAKSDAKLKDIEDSKINKAIWSPGRFTKIAYCLVETSDGLSPVEKSNFGISLSKGASYLFPSKPIAGMLKIGFDITWLDVTFASYKKSQGNSADSWTSDLDDYLSNDPSNMLNLNFSSMSYHLGLFGIGPRVSIAPFASKSNPLRYLRASVYFHYQPTISAYLLNDDGDIEGSYAYLGMMRFGGVLQYRRLGIGIEGYWGKAKFKSINMKIDDYDNFNNIFDNIFSDKKIDRKFAQTRIFIQFSF